MKATTSRSMAKKILKNTCVGLFIGFSLTSNLYAQQASNRVQYTVSAGNLDQVLNEISRNSGMQVVYNIDVLRGLKAGQVKGNLTIREALDEALKGSGLTWIQVNPTTISVKKKLAESTSLKNHQGSAAASPGLSETGDREKKTQNLEKMVVVGSRLGVSPVESAMPIHVITREQIDRSGSANIAQVLSYLSEISVNSNGDRQIGIDDGLPTGGSTNSTTVQMRGLPRGTTLILINGRRSGDSATYAATGQFDLSSIPLSLVERIEVLPAGSSAIYGGDGLAGVINIVLRRDANGLELRYRQSHAKGYGTRHASIVWGKTWPGADLTLAANWRVEDSLNNTQRSLTANQDYTRFGGYDWRAESGNPATVYSLEGCPAAPDLCFLDLSERGNLPGLSSPIAIVPAGSNGLGLTPADFLGTQGRENLTSYEFRFRSPEENSSLSMNGRKDLTESTEVFVEASYTKRKVPAFETPLTAQVPTWGYSYSRVPAANPYNPFGVDVAVGFLFTNTGLLTSYEQQYTRGAAGIRGKQKRFEWEISGWQVQDRTTTEGADGFDESLVIAAINSTNPATALNPFVSNGDAPGSPELMAALTRSFRSESKNRVTGFTGHIKGKPVDLPAGSLVALVGAEHLRQSLAQHTTNSSVYYQNVEGETRSTAYFAETRVPLLSARTGSTLERMALTAAMRSESSTRYQKSANTRTLGLEFRPVDSLLLRATHSTAFRPPLTFYSVLGTTFRTQGIEDPLFDNTRYQVRVREGGGAPADLQPESSQNSTVGFVYRSNSNWNFLLTHWNTEFKDQISYIDIQQFVDEEELRPGRVSRNASTGLIEEVDGRQTNIASLSAAGVDLAFDASWNTSIGDFGAFLAATYTYEHKRKSTRQSEDVSGLAQLTPGGWAPRWKIVPRMSWDRGATRGMLTGRYVSKYKDSEQFVTGPRVGETNILGGFWLFDVNFELSLGQLLGEGSKLSNTSLNIGATNLLNRLPDFCVGCWQQGYDASQYDIMGRTLYAEIRTTF